MSHKIPQEILLSRKTRIAKLDILVGILRLINIFENILLLYVGNEFFFSKYVD